MQYKDTAGASAPRLYNASHCLGTGFGILGRMNKFRVSIGYPEFVHGAKGIRTPDLYNANVARYQLCYSPKQSRWAG